MKYIFFIILSTVFFISGFSQPANDDFANATLLVHSSNNCSANGAYTTINATADLNKGSCWENGPNYNVWFKFVATTTNVTLDLKVGGAEGTMQHPNMALWESDGTTEIKCVRRINATTDVQISTSSLTIGNTYYVSVDNYVGTGYRGTFTLCIDDQVTYDDLPGAITITHSANNCSADAAYTTVNATADLNKGSCWENGPNYNRWFKFVATTVAVTLDLKVGGAEGTMQHPNMALWESDGTTEIKCVRRINATTDVQISTASLTIGNTYYVSVDNYVGLSYRGTFTLCIDNTVTYDDYNGAILLNDIHNWCSADAAYTTINATADLNKGSCWENGPNYNRWFKFVATTQFITLDLKVGGAEGTMQHPNMALWQADGITEVACVRRVNSTTDVQIATSGLTIGNTYYISVDNYVGLSYRGTFTICADDQPSYDYYEGAIEITDLNNWCSGNAAFTTINGTPDKNTGSCWENGPNYNRWFKFTAISPNVTIQMNVAGAEGTLQHPNMALWASDGTTELACVRRVNATTDVSIAYGSLVVGQTYYISCDNYVGLGYRGTFTLCVNNIDGTYYSRADGAWNNANTWSTVGIGGAPAADYPQSGDVVNIEGYTITLGGLSEVAAEVNINAATNTTGLTISGGGSLVVSGQFNITNPGNSVNTNVSVTNSTLNVNDDFTVNRNGGTATVALSFDNSTITLNKDLNINSSSGTNNNTLDLLNSATLSVQNLTLNNTGGPKSLATVNNSTLTINSDLTFTASADNKNEIALTNSGVLNLKQDVIRGTPAYGILNCAAGTTVNFNSTDNLQVFPHSTGSGTGDTFTYQNVVINNSRITTPQLTLDGAVTVNGTLTLTDGVVSTTSSNLLTLVAGSTLTGGSAASYIDGPLKKVGNTDFTFHIGDASIWAPLGIANLTGDAATEFTAEYSWATPVNNLVLKSPDPKGDLYNISGSEYWDLANTGTASNADVTLHWKNQSRSDIDNGPDLQIAHYDGAQWENLGQSSIVFADPGSITVTGVSSFSPFTFGSLSLGNNPLPVELIEFKSKTGLEGIQVSWITATEINNDYFELQKSRDGETFYPLAKIRGEGNSKDLSTYNYFDHRAYPGIQYYRLKQVDIDGSFDYSFTISASFKGPESISYFPNPVSGNEVSIVYSGDPQSIRSAHIMSIDGKVIQEVNYRIRPDGWSVPLDIPAGIYLLIIQTAEKTFRERLIKL